MPWTAGWNQPGYSPNPDNVSEFDTWGDAFAHLMDTVDRFWDDDYAAANNDRFRLLEIDGVWMPLHTRLHLATINTPFDGTTGGGEWAFWITPTEGN
jgi:hypothetical protein